MASKLLRRIISIAFAGALFMGTLIIGDAAGINSVISAMVRQDIKITYNGTLFNPTDGTGNPVYPVIINGSTYLPVRAVGSLAGLNVAWDGGTNTIALSTKDYVAPIVSVPAYPQPTEPSEVTVKNESENNDTLAAANPLGLEDKIQGLLRNGKADGTKDRDDWYRLEIIQEGKLTASLASSNEVNARIYLYAQGSNTIVNSDAQGTAGNRQVTEYIQPGVYYLKITGTDSEGKYDLATTFMPLNDQMEKNDEREEAKGIKLGQTIMTAIRDTDAMAKTDNTDWYSFTVSEGQTVTITCSATEKINTHLYLYAGTKTTILESDAADIKATRVISESLGAGTYYIRITGSSQGEYSLTVQ